MIRRRILYLVLSTVVAGVWLCLVADHAIGYHGPGSPSTVIHTAQGCGTSAIVLGEQFGPTALLPSSLLAMEQNPTYEDIRLTPPSPPPRG